MNTDQEKLMRDFLHDHQQLTRLLSDVIAHWEQKDFAAARSLARELDYLAGPHIEFEESILYPAVRSTLGESFQRRLLAEHSAAKLGLRLLLEASDEQLKDPKYHGRVLKALQTGLKHAESCGTLVSHLGQLSSDEKKLALAKLEKLKQQGRCWSELAG